VDPRPHGLHEKHFGEPVYDRRRPWKILSDFGGDALSVDWNQGGECAPDAETWMIGGRYLTNHSLSGVANGKHPAINEVGIPPPPSVITRDCRKVSGEITSCTERTAISGLLRRE
jgi:hypothetical protein